MTAERPELELRTMDWYISKWQRFLKLYRRLHIPEEMAESLYYNSNLGYYYNYIAIDMYERSSATLIFDCNDLANAMEAGMGVILDTEEISSKKTADEALSHSDLQSLDSQLYLHPDEAIRALRQATYLIMKEIHHDFAMDIKDSFKARFRNCRTRIELPDINDNHTHKLVSVRGIVTEYDVKSSRIYYESAWKCPSNHFTVVQGRNKPMTCDECNKHNLTLVPDRVRTDSYQEFKIQQRHDKTKTGRMAVEFDIALIGTDMQNIVISGDYVNVTGIVRVREERSHNNRQSDVAEFYIDASFVEKLPEDDILRLSEKDKAILREAVKDAVKPETEDIDFEIGWRSVAPTVIGHDMEKKALHLLSVGTKRRKFDDGTISRGPLNFLLCGSPATAKTVLANWEKRVFHRAVAPTGDGLSKPGLTAAVDPKGGRTVLKPGAYVLANGGIVVIDELNVIKPDIMSALLEPMEDNQTVTISKGGIHRVLDARCASLHMCNPKGTTHWDDNKTIVENTGLHPPQLSRYDAIFVFRDIPDAVEDAKKFDHWTKMYGDSVTDDNPYSADEQESMKEQPVLLRRGKIGNLHSLPFMAFWRLYVTETFDAKMDVSPDSKPLQMLRKFYLEMRNMDMTRFMSLDEMDDHDEATIQRVPSITMRQIGSLIRLAEASANAHHRNVVLEKDAELAIEIVRYSILNSGFNQALAKAGLVDYAQRGNYPKIPIIEIEKFANRKRDRWHKEAVRMFRTFAQQLKPRALGKCLVCRAKGVIIRYIDQKQVDQDCDVCGGLGSENLEFNIDHVKDNLKPRGFTQSDFEFVADTFIKYRIIERNPRTGYYHLVKRYSIIRGYGTVDFLEGINPEDIINMEEAEQKTKELDEMASESERAAMEGTLKRLETGE